MSRRLEVGVYWIHWVFGGDDDCDIGNYIVTKKGAEFYITEEGRESSFLRNVTADGFADWIKHEGDLRYQSDLREIEVRPKLIDGDKIITSTVTSREWRQTVIYLMNLL